MRQRRKYCRNERTFNFFGRKLIIFLFMVLFITIKGNNVNHTSNITNIIGDVDVDNIMNVDGKIHQFKMKQEMNGTYIDNKNDLNNNNNLSSIEYNKYVDRVKNYSIFEYNNNNNDKTDIMSSKNQLKLSEKILSRQRRYLIFPPGSSVQVGNDFH